MKKILICLNIKILSFFLKKTNENNILIIKVDVIGDYVVFRNFLRLIAIDAHQNSYKITLLGNEIWKDLFLEIDNDIINQVFFLKNDKTWYDFYRVINILSEIRYVKVINFHYNRNLVTDLLTFITSSKHKIGINGWKGKFNRFIRPLTNRIYTQLVDIPLSVKSEFECNRYFTSILINKEIAIERPNIIINHERQFINIELFNGNEYVVFAPGAGIFQRQLQIETIVMIVTLLLTEGYNICFVGSKNDTFLIKSVINKIDIKNSLFYKKVIDISGKVKLSDVMHVINRSLFVMCNDSGLYHLSLALNKEVFCFAGGGHYDWFVNYIRNNDKINIIHHSMPCYNCEWKCIYKFPKNEPYPCIKRISLNEMGSLLNKINYKNISANLG